MSEPMELWNGVGVDGDEELEDILGCILDFPMESLEGDGVIADWDASESQQLGPIPIDVLVGPPALAGSKVNAGPPVFMHTPLPINKSAEVQEKGTFQSQSPVSVLENGGPSLPGESLLLRSHIAKRTRSKRERPASVGPWLVASPSFSTSGKTCNAKRTKGRRNTVLRPSEDTSGTARFTPPASDYTAQPRPTKKCTHCEITKTPQWREGPLGPKTLCNACGVRYRSGRLFPEYRPAASPTFVPSLHSNSHKKVIEMRNKDKLQVNIIQQLSIPPQLELTPASSYLFDPIC